jgi:hypothetical protein
LRAFQAHQEHNLKHPSPAKSHNYKTKQTTFIDRFQFISLPHQHGYKKKMDMCLFMNNEKTIENCVGRT